MNEILERVVQVIADGVGADKPSSDIALDVFAAIREPTPRMILMGCSQMPSMQASAVWREMIDEALK